MGGSGGDGSAQLGASMTAHVMVGWWAIPTFLWHPKLSLCTAGHGAVGMVVTGQRLDLVNVEVFSSLSDSVVL